MIIDLHAHLLPGIDDGAQTLAHSLELARIGAAEGARHVVLTPHHRNGQYNNYKKAILQATEDLQRAYTEAGINMQVYASQEIRLTENFLDDLYNDYLLSLDAAGRYYLIEFPSREVPAFAPGLLANLISLGITPVIAHPERNHVLANDLHALYELIEMGCLAQVTTSSYAGYYGTTLQQNSRKIIAHNLAHILASDVHHIEQRPFNLAKAFDLMTTEFGQATTTRFQDNARQIFNGEDVQKQAPQLPKHRVRKWFNVFSK